MKKNKFAILAIAIVSIFFFSACTNEDDFQNEKINLSKKKETSNISTELIAADLINAIKLNPIIATEINNAICHIVDYDLGENLTFYDILSTSNSVFFNSDKEFLNLKQSINEKTLSGIGLYNPNTYYNNLNIYWGYHDSWDKNTLPIICYLTGNDNNTLNGFKIVNREIVNVTVTEEEFDSETQPIIVINFNEIDYSEYPDFKNGVRTKGNVTWPYTITKERSEELEEAEEPINEWTNPNKIYKAVLRSIKSGGTQYDKWYQGDNEFKVKSVYFSLDSVYRNSEHATHFTRKEVKNKVQKYYEYLSVFNDWQVQFDNMGFAFIEYDGGTIDPISVDLSISKLITIKANIPKLDLDYIVGHNSIDRVDYINNYIYNTTWYGYGDCSIALGMIIRDRPY